jgi:outer membrane protein, adhesin transport system
VVNILFTCHPEPTRIPLKYFLIPVVTLSLLLPNLQAETLEAHLNTTLESNPKLQQRISEYRSATYELDKAYSGYKPTVDITAGIGPEHTDKLAPNPDESNDLIRKEASVVLTENLFDGLNTTHSIEEQKSRVKTARYYALQEANSIALRATETYLAVLLNKSLLDVEHENVLTHERIFHMTREKMSAGLGRRSDLEQTEARMAQAYANYIAQQNNYQDAMVNFERVNGRLLSGSAMEQPDPALLPAEDLDGLITIALKHNSSLVIEHANIDTQTARYHKEKSGFYPTVDAELSADYQNDIDGFENDDRAYRAMLRVYYNLYNGGVDEATRKQNLEIIASQKSAFGEQTRAVLEKLKLAWLSYQYYEHRIRCLELFAKLTRKTADSYGEEYHLGRRSLLDLLNVELEANSARQEVLRAHNGRLYAYYRILEATGLITFGFETGLHDRLDMETPEAAHFDRMPSSRLLQFGETGEYLDITDVCRRMYEPIRQEIFEPEKEVVDRFTVNGIHFKFNSTAIPEADALFVDPVLETLREYPELLIEIHGHTDNVDKGGVNRIVSKRRAETARDILVRHGISPEIITVYGHADTQPVADNDAPEGRRLNRRVEIVLVRSDTALKESGE